MVEQVSPLGTALKPGRHNVTGPTPAVTLAETRPGSIVQVAAWHGQEKALIGAIQAAVGLKLPDGAGGGVATEHKAAFGFAPGKFLVVTQVEGIEAELVKAIPIETVGTVTDLSHGRTALRVSGPKSEWVLQKALRDRLRAGRVPAGFGPLDRPPRRLHPDPAHRRRPVRPLHLPLLRPLFLDDAVPCGRRGWATRCKVGLKTGTSFCVFYGK